MILSNLKDHLPTILEDFPTIRLVYLFGSQVSGRVGPMSDYDLAILDQSQEDRLTIQVQFQHAISKLLDTGMVDVVHLDQAPIELAYHIIAKGKLLFQRDLYTRVEFEAQVLGKYGDYLPTLRSFNQRTIEGDANGKRVQRYREAFRRTQRTLGSAQTSSRTGTR